MLKLVIRRDSDGLFFRSGIDAPDSWVKDPLDADDRDALHYEKDARRGMGEGFSLIEFRISATPTGRTHKDLYKDGVSFDPVTSSKRLYVHLEDLNGPVVTFELDVALWDKNRYAGEMRGKVLRTARPTLLRIEPDGGTYTLASLGDLGLDLHLVAGTYLTMPNGFGISN